MKDLLFFPDLCFDDLKKKEIKKFYESLNKNLKKINFKGYIFANLESPIISKNLKPLDIKKKNLQTAKSSIKKIKGLNFFLGNNHIFDYGPLGLKNTLKELVKKKIPFTGSGMHINEASKPLIIKNRIKIAIFSLSYRPVATKTKSGVFNINSLNSIKRIQSFKIKNNIDKIICYCHSGLELFPFPLIKDEIYYKKLIDSGVDLVIGSHSHIIQQIEKYNEKFIFYSIGDALFNNLKKYSFKKMLKKPSHAFYYQKLVKRKLLMEGYVIKLHASSNYERIEIMKLKRHSNHTIKITKLNNLKLNLILKKSYNQINDKKNILYRQKIESRIFN